jgi:hypothetical protein
LDGVAIFPAEPPTRVRRLNQRTRNLHAVSVS